jgi:hypothetical protein
MGQRHHLWGGVLSVKEIFCSLVQVMSRETAKRRWVRRIGCGIPGYPLPPIKNPKVFEKAGLGPDLGMYQFGQLEGRARCQACFTPRQYSGSVNFLHVVSEWQSGNCASSEEA